VLLQTDIRDLINTERHVPFDTVISVDVIEHIPEADALNVAKSIRVMWLPIYPAPPVTNTFMVVIVPYGGGKKKLL